MRCQIALFAPNLNEGNLEVYAAHLDRNPYSVNGIEKHERSDTFALVTLADCQTIKPENGHLDRQLFARFPWQVIEVKLPNGRKVECRPQP